MVHLSAGQDGIGIRMLKGVMEGWEHRVTLATQRKATGRPSTLDGCQSEEGDMCQDRQTRQDRAEDVHLSWPAQGADEAWGVVEREKNEGKILQQLNFLKIKQPFSVNSNIHPPYTQCLRL